MNFISILSFSLTVVIASGVTYTIVFALQLINNRLKGFNNTLVEVEQE